MLVKAWGKGTFWFYKSLYNIQSKKQPRYGDLVMKKVCISLLKRAAFLLFTIFSQLSVADLPLDLGAEIEHSFLRGTGVDTSNLMSNLTFSGQVIDKAYGFNSVIKVADIDGDERLTESELIKAYYSPDINPNLYPLIARIRINFNLLMDPRVHMITLDSYQAGYSSYFDDLELFDNLSEDALWEYAFEGDHEEKLVMGRLFSNGLGSIRPEAVNQRGIGNCQMMSAIASLARTPYGKRLLLSYFDYLGEGKVRISFPGADKPIDLVLNEVVSSYAYSSYDDEWVKTLEWAVARQSMEDGDTVPCSYNYTGFYGKEILALEHGQYRMLDAIGTSYVIRLLTGVEGDYKTFRYSSEDVHELMSDFLLKHPIVTAGISDSSGLYPELPRDHFYSVLAYDKTTQRVTLRDPNGTFEVIDQSTGKAADGVSDGIFSLSLEEFKILFIGLRFSKKPKANKSVM
ncbi:MAG: hypothetical protein ACR2PT_14645 [Endozoicomonas sp.]